MDKDEALYLRILKDLEETWENEVEDNVTRVYRARIDAQPVQREAALNEFELGLLELIFNK
jgi:hypothetical protein